jgi:uncharacterized protein (TIGR02217 family)
MVSPYTELQAILGFFEQCAGEGASFYFEPPMLSPASAQSLGTGDGSTTTFALTVSLGGYALIPAGVGGVAAIYFDGIAQPVGCTITGGLFAPSVMLATAPPAGAAVTADFHWYLLCRFDDDDADVEEFMSALYALQSLTLRTVRS